MLAATLLHFSFLAQITVVPGDPAALQAAIDSAPAGSTLLVQGGTYDPISIDKPLELVAEPAARFLASDLCRDGVSGPLVSISGPGSGRVTLQNFSVLGELDGSSSSIGCGSLEPIVDADGLDELWLIDCDFSAQWGNASGSAPGAPGLATSVPYVVVSSAVVGAVSAETDLDAGFPQFAGIAAPDSDVVISASVVNGGSYRKVQSCPGPPFAGGLLTPAPAVVARRVFRSGSVVEADNTTEWECFPGLDGVVQFDVPDVQAALDTAIFRNLAAETAPLRGATWDLTAETQGAGGLLFVNSDTAAIEFLPQFGWSFLTIAETLFVEPLASGATSLSYPIPAEPALVGFELAAQALDLELLLLGGPVIAQIR